MSNRRGSAPVSSSPNRKDKTMPTKEGPYSKSDMGKDKIRQGPGDDPSRRGKEVQLPKDEPGGLSGPAPLPRR
jgi:hypothetical protein